MRRFRWAWTLAAVAGNVSGLAAQHPVDARNVTPPRITAFTASPTELTASGGTVTIELHVAADTGVARVVLTALHPDGRQGSSSMRPSPGADGAKQAATPAGSTWLQTIEIPGNTATRPAIWTFSVAALDDDGNDVRAGPITVTVAGPSPEMIIYMAPERKH